MFCPEPGLTNHHRFHPPQKWEEDNRAPLPFFLAHLQHLRWRVNAGGDFPREASAAACRKWRAGAPE
jgi:hypothetical protein